ncbi:MAG TPA: hypothetical protein DDW84_01440 [Phycisphaerales bacterium]|nr:MAG: hypothetical protein A2Y13_01235 [Planctomycetes bacterium GWC2_45_44]HBG77500.1 hypothetical protein [Phycisphaerales bacterium]HBR19108.1 hypothetical protein [Phycisphaerales bacterium]
MQRILKITGLVLILAAAAYVSAATLRQNTATTITVGHFRDWSDGKAVLTDNNDFDVNDIVCELAIGSENRILPLKKTGDANDNILTLTGYGLATLTLCPNDVNVAGNLMLSFTSYTDPCGVSTDTILAFREDYTVLPANTYDSLYAGSGKLQVDISQVAGTSVSGISDFKITGFSTLTVADVNAQAQNALTSYGVATASQVEDVNSYVITGLWNPTYGLPAIKTAINDVNDNITHSTFDPNTDPVIVKFSVPTGDPNTWAGDEMMYWLYSRLAYKYEKDRTVRKIYVYDSNDTAISQQNYTVTSTSEIQTKIEAPE